MEEELNVAVPIDVTPMATIGLLLVIVFMATAPTWMQPLMDVELPEAHTAQSESKQNVTISIGPNGELATDDVDIKWAELDDALLIALEENKDKFVIIRADKKAKYGQMIKVMHAAKKAGAKNLTIATKQTGKKEKDKNGFRK